MLVCVAIAVLKYRLYAIDRIISRIISYLIVTAVPGCSPGSCCSRPACCR